MSFFKKHFIHDRRFYKFLCVGLLNTVFGYSIYLLLLFLGLHYAVAMFFATVLGVLFNFKTIGRLVFKSSKNALIFRFVVIYTVIYLLNTGIVKTTMFFGCNASLSGAVALVIAAPIAFFLNKIFVFRSSYEAY